MSAGEIINCEDTKNGKERSGSSGDPLVVSIGKILNKEGKFLIFEETLCILYLSMPIWLYYQTHILLRILYCHIVIDITNRYT